MPVKRISEINISQRGLFTAIYGNVNEDEFFVDDDLKKYSLWSQLYLYLKEESYEIVLFYDTTNNFHSYSQSDLIKFLNINQNPTGGIVQKEKYVASHIKSPLRQQRLNAVIQPPQVDENPVHQSIQLVTEYGSSNNYYRTTISSNDILLAFFKKFLADTSRKVAVIIKYPDNSSFEFVDQYLTLFRELNANYKKDESKNKIIIVYGCSNSESLIENLNRHSNYLFVNEYFKSIFLNAETNSYKVKLETTFQTALPDQTEIRNWLNRKRLKNGVHLFNSIPLDKIALRFIQERKRLTDFENYDAPKFIGDISTKSGWDKLNEMIGLESVKAKVKDIVEDLKYKREQQMEFTFRPHLCFLGNPGTGKTTVASIVAEIFKEEGIVPLGHYISTKATELMGQHVGEAASLVKKKCEEATGGILFIDEAYAFIEEGTKFYGDSAVTELIAWLEDKKWQKETIVILAGYPDEINDLFKKSNKGLRGRFTDDHYLTFENYKAKELCQIFELNTKKNRLSISPNAKALLESVFAKLLQTNMDNKHWDNARRVENFFKLIFSNLRKRKSAVIEVCDIPENLTSIVNGKSVSDIRQTQEYIELNNLIGLQNVKHTINDLIEAIEFEQYQIDHGMQFEKSVQPLHLVFSGAPGTGKTTVARLFGGLLFNLGILTKNEKPLEVGRDDLVGDVIGSSEKKTKEAIEKAMGGVLFIDEAYTLGNVGGNDFGQKAIEILLKRMEDDRDKFCVIAAGYTDEMKHFLDSNSGLKSRFHSTIFFQQYLTEELIEIFISYCKLNNIKYDQNLDGIISQYMILLQNREGRKFGNAREVRKLFDDSLRKQQKRLNAERKIKNLTTEEISILKKQLIQSDLSEAIYFLNSDLHEKIDFNCCSDPISLRPSETIQTNNGIELDKMLRNPVSISIEQEPDNSNPIKSVGLLKTKEAVGTAFLISKEGYLVTANHVVKNSETATFLYNTDKVEYKTELVWASKEIDIAILKIVSEKQDFIPIEICFKNEDPEIKEEVALIGYPRGGQLSDDPFYTESIISNFSRKFKVDDDIIFDAIATYTNASGGYSGGPLIRRSDNKVIGVLHGGLPHEGNINYASDIRQLFSATNLTLVKEKSINLKEAKTEIVNDNINLFNNIELREEKIKFENFGIFDSELQKALDLLLYDYCIIDTNIWMNENPIYMNNNLKGIRMLMNLYKYFKKNLVAHGKTYEELMRISLNKENKYIKNVSISANDGFEMLRTANEVDLIKIPELGGEHDRNAYADLAIYNYAKEIYLLQNSVMLITDDKDCRIRVKSVLTDVNSSIDFKFLKAYELKRLYDKIYYSAWYENNLKNG